MNGRDIEIEPGGAVSVIEATTTGIGVIAAPHPFRTQRVAFQALPGSTLAEIVRRAGVHPGLDARVFIEHGGVLYGPIPKEWWPRVRPKTGSLVSIRGRAMGGGSGGDSNKTLRMILLAVVIIIAIVIIVASYGTLTPLALWLIGIGVTVAFIAINMLLPPQFPKLGKLANLNNSAGKAPESATMSITGSQNKANPYGPVPRIYGQHQMFPLYGAVPFTEIVGPDQYLRELFVIGYGPVVVEDLKIGDTPLTDYVGVEVEVRQGFPDDEPLTLYTQDVSEDPLTIALTVAGGPQARTGSQLADELSVDVVCANGLVQFTASGSQLPVTVEILVEYRKTVVAPEVPGPWLPAPGGPLVISDNRLSQARGGLRWRVTERATYEVQLRRTTPDSIDPLVHDQTTWSSLRSIIARDPVVMPGLAKIALRIKATDQLNGVVDQLNCVVTSILPDWDAATQTWITRPTQSPAAAYRDCLQGPANARPVADARMHLESLQDWAERSAAGGFTYNQVVDFRTTVLEQLRDIAGGARAAFTMIDGRFGVVQDIPQAVPVQHLTPRNSFNFNGSRIFLDELHALKVRFINPAERWQQDERIVYADGFDETTATRFEVLETVGVTHPEQAWKIGRYHMAVAKLRPEIFSLSVDIEGLICTRGDRVQLTHDVLLIGLAVGRLTAVQVDPLDAAVITALVVDAECPLEVEKSYVVRVRCQDGTSLTLPVAPQVTGLTQILILVAAYSGSPVPAVGDLVQFGEAGLESMPVIVKEIESDKDFNARLTLLPYSPDVYLADQGPIPPYQSFITQPPELHKTPPVPVIDAVRSDESVLLRGIDGTLTPRIVLSVRYIANSKIPADTIQVQYRRSDSSGPFIALASLPAGTPEISIAPVEERVAHDVRLRSTSRIGATSEWTILLNHLVIGKTTPPPGPMGLVLVGQTLVWSYPTPPPDLDGFTLKRVAGAAVDWDGGLLMHGGVVGDTTFPLPPINGLTTLMVRARDTGGNLSTEIASLTQDFGAPLLHNLVETRDEYAVLFPGLKTACTRNGVTGVLEADQVPAGFWGPDLSRFWTSDAALFWTSPYQTMVYTWTYVTGALAAGTTLLLDFVAQGAVTVEWKRTADSAWLPFVGAIQGIQALTGYDLRVMIAGGPVQGIITTLVLYLDAPDLEENFQGVALAATTGTRLALTQSYRAINTVQVTVVASGGETAITAIAADKDATLGPLVKAYDAAGAVVAGHVDAVVRGF